jgi:hypothetical protein
MFLRRLFFSIYNNPCAYGPLLYLDSHLFSIRCSTWRFPGYLDILFYNSPTAKVVAPEVWGSGNSFIHSEVVERQQAEQLL